MTDGALDSKRHADNAVIGKMACGKKAALAAAVASLN